MTDPAKVKEALAEFGFELDGLREPTPGAIGFRIRDLLQALHEGLRSPTAAASLKTSLARLERLALALEAYDELTHEQRSDQTKNYGA
jgi:hypothetical protein